MALKPFQRASATRTLLRGQEDREEEEKKEP